MRYNNNGLNFHAINDSLFSGDLPQSELDETWKTVHKYLDGEASIKHIDVDSSIKIYRDIYDIFEDNGVDMEGSTLKNGMSQDNKDTSYDGISTVYQIRNLD